MERPRNYTDDEWRRLSLRARKAHAEAWRKYRAAEAALRSDIQRGAAYKRARNATLHDKPDIPRRRLHETQSSEVSVADMYPHLYNKTGE